MAMLEPGERSARGQAIKEAVVGQVTPAPSTLWEESWRDFVYAEVWSRPGLERRKRYLVAIAGAAMAGSERDVDLYVYGALKSGELLPAEIREAALHVSVYGGWSAGGLVDAAASRTIEVLGLQAPALPPLRAAAWDPDVRSQEGAEEFKAVMTFPGGPPMTPYLEAIRNFVFGEMWPRYDGLDQASRRWITLVGVCMSMADTPMRSHIHAAMASGNCSADEMQEFVLQYGVQAGWPKASQVQAIVFEMIRKVQAGLPYDG